MLQISKNSFFTLLLIFTAAVFVDAQTDATTKQGDAPKEEYSKGIQETLAKQRIEREKKDFDEMLARGEEAVKLSDQLEKSYEQNKQFSSEDQKKLERLEKVVKKIRNEMGGDGDDELEEKPLSVAGALDFLKTGTTQLVDELKKTSRYSISVTAVESSNALLKVVQFLRLSKK